MTGWVSKIRLGLAAIFGLAVGAEGIYTAQMRSVGEKGFVTGMMLGVVLILLGLLIFYSQLRYEKKLGLRAMSNGIGESPSVGGRMLLGLGSLFIGLGHVAFAVSAIYFIVALISISSHGGASGIPLAVGLFGGAFCYLLGDAFKKAG